MSDKAEDAVARFTPGPWRARGAGIFGGPDDKLLAATGDDSTNSFMVAEQIANATLISSAPDMYAALETAEAMLTRIQIALAKYAPARGFTTEDSDDMKMIRAALRKARGQQ